MNAPVSAPNPGHSLLLWAARLEEPAAVRLVCAEAADQVRADKDENVVVWRGCLATLPAALPFELLTLGASGIVLDRTGCEANWPTAWDEIALVAGVTDRITVQTEAPADGRTPKRLLDADAMPVLRRRSIFGLGAVNQEAAPELPDQGTPQQRLRAVARKLASQLEEPAPAPEDGWRAGALNLVSQGCTACRVCVLACPTEALALESASGRAGLGFDPSLCTGCGICVLRCDPNALSENGRLGAPALLAGPVLLELFEVRTCERCRTAFRGSGKYCPVCEYRVANPFGHTMPPGWRPSK